jgi:hypothetical protein
MPIHRRGAENAEGAQRVTEALVNPLRFLCVLCASAVNEVFLTSPLKLTRRFGCGSAAQRLCVFASDLPFSYRIYDPLLRGAVVAHQSHDCQHRQQRNQACRDQYRLE